MANSKAHDLNCPTIDELEKLAAGRMNKQTRDYFGHDNSMPLGAAPTVMQKLAHTDGELATARACKEMGIVMGLSSFSTTSLEDVKTALGSTHPGVLQLYLFEECEVSRKLIQRAKKVGYKAVFLAVDTPILGRRNLEIRNQFTETSQHCKFQPR
ncbi:FMN-dependent dehydrogenase-domain-containing protein [Phaeosphaeriaceae sp. PMI808]|nr:FMN-dependent dehydrogenase-domain-containing protein [Phaeosphaeriaceae sp. PMI808]